MDAAQLSARMVSAEVVTDDAVIFAMSTTDYDVFVFDPANRPVNRNHVEKLKASISKRNLLSSYPIIVSAQNGEWVVRDGQHRLVAARELGVPIYYTFNDDMTTDDVSFTNGAQASWSSLDFLYHFCARGFAEYVRFREFMERHPWMTFAVAVNLCTYGDRTATGFKSGEYKCNDVEFAEQVAQAVLQFSRWVPFYRESVFIGAIAQLFEHEGYNHERMLRKMEFQSTRLVKCVNIEEYLRIFSSIYNYQAKEADKFRFEKLNSNSRNRRGDRRNKRKSAQGAE